MDYYLFRFTVSYTNVSRLSENIHLTLMITNLIQGNIKPKICKKIAM